MKANRPAANQRTRNPSSQILQEVITVVKVAAPCLSLGASGSLGGALVFSSWKGRSYVRELVKPSNPRSGGQVGVRAMFKGLSQNWAALTAGNKATWEERADSAVISPFNAFMGYNQARWRNFLGVTQEDPATAAGTNAVWGAATAVAGVRQITITKAITTANDAWLLGIHRELTTAQPNTFANCIAVFLAASIATFTYVDTPLAADEYFYNFSVFTDEGLRELEDDEVNATVV